MLFTTLLYVQLVESYAYMYINMYINPTAGRKQRGTERLAILTLRQARQGRPLPLPGSAKGARTSNPGEHCCGSAVALLPAHVVS